MANHPFGEALARLRKEQGFESAHAFYRARAGRRTLGLSFANYLLIEKGRSLPKAFRVKNLIAALGLKSEDRRAGGLVRAYLVSLLGSEELLGILDQGGARAGSPASWRLAEEAARQALSQRTVQLSEDQWKTLAAERPAHDCHMLLVNTPGWRPISEVQRSAGLSAPEAARTLRLMAAAGLVELSGG